MIVVAWPRGSGKSASGCLKKPAAGELQRVQPYSIYGQFRISSPGDQLASDERRAAEREVLLAVTGCPYSPRILWRLPTSRMAAACDPPSRPIPFLGARIYGLDRIFVYYCYSYIYFKNIQKAFVIVLNIFILKCF